MGYTRENTTGIFILGRRGDYSSFTMAIQQITRYAGTDSRYRSSVGHGKKKRMALVPLTRARAVFSGLLPASQNAPAALVVADLPSDKLEAFRAAAAIVAAFTGTRIVVAPVRRDVGTVSGVEKKALLTQALVQPTVRRDVLVLA